MLIELQAMIACEDVPRTSSSAGVGVGVGIGASAVVLVGKVVGVVGAILVDEADECKTVDIGDRGGSAPASVVTFVHVRSLGVGSRGSQGQIRVDQGRSGQIRQKTELDTR